MWTPSSTPSRRRSPRNRAALLAAAALALAACSDPAPAAAQVVVFDPQNHAENALQAARQLETLANQARMLANQARELAASPYDHIAQTSETLGAIGELARDARGMAATVQDLQRQFEDLYPTAVQGLDPRRALQQGQARTEAARATAQDVARTAAELDRLSRGRAGRLKGALAASQAAEGQTAAIQSSTQVLAVLAEDLAAMRTLLLVQSRLMAEATARQAADRAAATEQRRRLWADHPSTVSPPAFDPLPHSKY